MFLNHSGCLIFPSVRRVHYSHSMHKERNLGLKYSSAAVRTHSQVEGLPRSEQCVVLLG